MLKFRLWKTAKLLPCLTTLAVMFPFAFGQAPLTTAQIAKTVSPSVVVIQGKTESGEALGSGFIVSKDGKIVTNLHVIRDLTTVNVQMTNGDVFDTVSVLATDERRDLAVVQVAGFDLPALELGDSGTLAVGEPVVAVGSPRGLEGSVTAGILSAVRDGGEGFKVLQTDAAVNPGNSGGPLVDGKARAIGVVSFKLRSAEGLNFAVPINYVRGLLNALHEPMTLGKMRENLSGEEGTTNPSTKGPSLKETLDWLKEKLPLGIVRDAVLFPDRDTLYTTTQNKVWSLGSCNAVFGSEMTTTLVSPSTIDNHPLKTTDRNTVPLGILKASVYRCENPKGCPGWFVNPDGGEVLVGGDRYYYIVGLSSTSKEILSEGFIEALPTYSENVNHFDLAFNDESLAQRVAAAFGHAADLCKGKQPF